MWIRGGIDRDVQIQGPILLSGRKALKHYRRFFVKYRESNKGNYVKLHEKINIPYILEQSNIFLGGAQGSGKSTIIKWILPSILTRGDKALIYDAKREYTSIFFGSGNYLMNPFDVRSVCWNISEDISSIQDAQSIASCFITESKSDKFWSDGARLILTGCFIHLTKTKTNWCWEDLSILLNSSNQDLRLVLDKSYPEASKLVEVDSKTTQGFMTVIATQLSWIANMDKVWTNKHGHLFSVKRWLRDEEQKGSLIIPNDPKHHLVSSALCSAVMSLVVAEILARSDTKNNRFWLVLDEVSDLGKTSYLESWLSLSRSKGGRTIAGTQNISQLADLYGSKGAETILSLFGISINLRVGQSFDTAQFLSKTIGSRIVQTTTLSYDASGQRTKNIQKKEEPLVRPEDLMHLPLPDHNGVQGFLSIGGCNAVYRLTWDYPDLNVIANDIEPIDNHSIDLLSSTTSRGRRGGRRSVDS